MSHQTDIAAPPEISATAAVPPLESGDRLSSGAEFMRRYEAHPEINKAEFIAGVVYVASPVRFKYHGQPHADILLWLGYYRAVTPHISTADNTTLYLDADTIVQPDACLWRTQGRSVTATEDDYLEGAPELVVEVAASSAAYDLHDKRCAYEHAGVQEYLVVQVYERHIDWWTLREGGYAALEPDEQGILRSAVFPGLWLAASAFWADTPAKLLEAVQQGTRTAEHAAFVEQLRQQAAPHHA